MNRNDVFDTPVSVLSDYGLSHRDPNPLEKKLYVRTIRYLIGVTPQQVTELPNCGQTAVEHVATALGDFVHEAQEQIDRGYQQ